MAAATGPAAIAEDLGLRRCADELVALSEHALAGDMASVSSADVERVLTAATKLYAAKQEAGEVAPPLSADKVTPTEVVTVVTEMLRAVNLNLFDLAMWYRRAR